MWKQVTLVVLSIILFSSAFPLHQGIADVPPETTISVEPQGTFGLSPGQSFAIDISVSSVTDLFAWEFTLYYRNAVLNGTSVIEGPFLVTGGSTFFNLVAFSDNYNATHGYVIVGCTRVGNVTGADGSGILATVIFKAVGAGYSLLHLDNTKLWNSELNKIPPTVVDGEVYVGSVDVAVGGIDALANIAKGSTALINVTAQNRGGFPETFDVTLYYNGTLIETKTVASLPGTESQLLTFAWDTNPVPIGAYNLTATATSVPGETDMSDNTFSLMVYVGTVDLAVTNLTSLKTVVGQGYSTPINVTAANQGQVSGTSNITVYANQTVIATFQNITLASGDSITLTFTWNTSAPTKGNFTISAYFDPLPFEINTSNNNFTSSTIVMVGMPGDVVSPFGTIDMKDVAYVAKRFGTKPGDTLWDTNADIDGSGKVDMKDIAIVARGFGSHDP